MKHRAVDIIIPERAIKEWDVAWGDGRGTRSPLTRLRPDTLFCAHEPQAINTTPRPIPVLVTEFVLAVGKLEPPHLSMTAMTLSVNFSQPWPECEPGVPALTVKQVLSMRTPFLAQPTRFLAFARHQSRCYERTVCRKWGPSTYPCLGTTNSGYSDLISV